MVFGILVLKDLTANILIQKEFQYVLYYYSYYCFFMYPSWS